MSIIKRVKLIEVKSSLIAKVVYIKGVRKSLII
jgi:hypothetical protein